MFSLMRDSVTLLGIVTTPRCVCHLEIQDLCWCEAAEGFRHHTSVHFCPEHQAHEFYTSSMLLFLALVCCFKTTNVSKVAMHYNV